MTPQATLPVEGSLAVTQVLDHLVKLMSCPELFASVDHVWRMQAQFFLLLLGPLSVELPLSAVIIKERELLLISVGGLPVGRGRLFMGRLLNDRFVFQNEILDLPHESSQRLPINFLIFFADLLSGLDLGGSLPRD